MSEKVLRIAAAMFLACAPLLAGAANSESPSPTSPEAAKPSEAIERSESWDVAPRFKRGTVPLYPLSYIHKDRPGSAIITYTVTEDGKAKDVVVVSASDPAFGAHVAQAIRRWSHYPATKDGKPVSATITREFSLTFD